jgi:hypothetical protein
VNSGTAWAKGLVRFSAHADRVFPNSTLSSTARTVTRSSTLSGYKFLDLKRTPTVEIQPSIAVFSSTFTKLTDGLLEGLDWNNVFVAGGVVLASLLCVENAKSDTGKAESYKNSDIDIYIYGLSLPDANKKIEHIFEVYKRNLPPDAPTMVVRNSKTINFISTYPLKRIQIVLKLAKNPAHVLLNFDLDICSMGWDGKDLWMLPRAARALESQLINASPASHIRIDVDPCCRMAIAGYNVFTMNVVEGHYLGERRASHEQRSVPVSLFQRLPSSGAWSRRVFKYADRVHFSSTYVRMKTV